MPSLPYSQPQRKRRSESPANVDDDGDGDQDISPDKNTGAEEEEEEDPGLRRYDSTEDKDEDDIEPGLAGETGSERDEERQNGLQKSTLGNLDREPFQTSSSDRPSINLPMGRARRAQWEQLADIFDLDSTHRANALRISSITGSQNQFQAGVCLMQKVLQELGKKSTENHATAASAAWVPRSDFGTRIIDVMRRTLKDHTIEAYTNTMGSDKRPIIGSFHRKAMQALLSQTPEWKAETLPPNFGNTLDDLTAHVKFMGEFKDRLRHQRDGFRVILLKNIRVTTETKDEEPLPVPTMGTLLGDLARFFGPESRTDKEIEAATDPSARARFAYLRLETAKYSISSNDEKIKRPGKSQWDWIDPQLATLRDKDRAYRRAFDSIILARDEYFFDGKKTIEDVKADEMEFGLPTEEDVLTAVRFTSSQHNN